MNNTQMTMLLNLEHRVTKLEKIVKEEKNNELAWALSQFQYIAKDYTQRKALTIIAKELGLVD